MSDTNETTATIEVDTAEYERRARNGVAFLDAHVATDQVPANWRELVRWDELLMRSNCVMVQLYDTWSVAGGEFTYPVIEDPELGFFLGAWDDETYEERGLRWSALTNAWKNVAREWAK